jgi:hypothetical protein
VSFQDLQEGKIAVGESMFKHMLKIANGLMIMNGESEFDLFHKSSPWTTLPPLILKGKQKIR